MSENVTFECGATAPAEAVYPGRPDLQLGAIRSGVPATYAEWRAAAYLHEHRWDGAQFIVVSCSGKPARPHPAAVVGRIVVRDGHFAGCDTALTTTNVDGTFTAARFACTALTGAGKPCPQKVRLTAQHAARLAAEMAASQWEVSISALHAVLAAWAAE